MIAPSDDEWPEGLTEDVDKLFLNDKLLLLKERVEALIDHWHNAQLMQRGHDKMQRDLAWFEVRGLILRVLDAFRPRGAT